MKGLKEKQNFSQKLEKKWKKIGLLSNQENFNKISEK
ncbi:unnamed protein product (macronuclear) [Paramecium tetraurelia]|uniref:Uncharacterized protein n=1 Tax=Paramecium tetraurelia TaxID=5888 RepID=A0CYS4_PARTE|nr:uncharacterized protein GSPATT00011542001 [Paramecium tetraurelia]CAK75941.1 unnamed protein product [Paramecium tetraurelia]